MVFEFRILGLFLLLFLVLIYSFKTVNYKRNNNFRFILVSTYLLEFLYLICYIFIRKEMCMKVATKIYFGCFSLVLILFMYYFIYVLLEDKYRAKESILLQKKSFVKKIIMWLCFCLLVAIYFISDSVVYLFILGVGLFFSIFQLILLILKGKHLHDYRALFGFVCLEVFFILFQFIFPKVEIMDSGMILLTTYLYLFLENSYKKEVDILSLERDYAIKNMIDKEAFLRKLSHEIRIPINTIDGFSQVLLDTDSIEEMKEEANDIRQASLELIDLINSMIDLSILESGELKIIKENYNIYDTLENLVKMIPSRIRSTDVSFDFKIEEGIPEVLLGDSERISQVILNVLSHSIKYTDKGSIRLEVNAVKSNSLCRLIIKVIDTGKGMSKEEINQVFSRDGEENRIGLRIAYYLLQLMNGKLDIDSEVEKGTTTVITIDQEIVALKQERSSKKNKDVQPISFKGKRIMIVDDNKLNLKVASKLLVPYDVEVINVGSGEECLDILDKDTNFDLILMDDLMPNMSGIETLDVLRKIERVAGYYIPVVALTANATTGMKEKYLNSGFDDYLSKPIDRMELDIILRKYLK